MTSADGQPATALQSDWFTSTPPTMLGESPDGPHAGSAASALRMAAGLLWTVQAVFICLSVIPELLDNRVVPTIAGWLAPLASAAVIDVATGGRAPVAAGPGGTAMTLSVVVSGALMVWMFARPRLLGTIAAPAAGLVAAGAAVRGISWAGEGGLGTQQDSGGLVLVAVVAVSAGFAAFRGLPGMLGRRSRVTWGALLLGLGVFGLLTIPAIALGLAGTGEYERNWRVFDSAALTGAYWATGMVYAVAIGGAVMLVPPYRRFQPALAALLIAVSLGPGLHFAGQLRIVAADLSAEAGTDERADRDASVLAWGASEGPDPARQAAGPSPQHGVRG